MSFVSSKSLKYISGVTVKQTSIHSALLQMVTAAQQMGCTLTAIGYPLFGSLGHFRKSKVQQRQHSTSAFSVTTISESIFQLRSDG